MWFLRLEINHIGYAVKDINKPVVRFKELGFNKKATIMKTII
jgi:hypothetical protein